MELERQHLALPFSQPALFASGTLEAGQQQPGLHVLPASLPARGKDIVDRLQPGTGNDCPPLDGLGPGVPTEPKPPTALSRRMARLVERPDLIPVVAFRGRRASRDAKHPPVKTHGGLRYPEPTGHLGLRSTSCEQPRDCRASPSPPPFLAHRTQDDDPALHRRMPGPIRDPEFPLALDRAMPERVVGLDGSPI